MQTLKKWWGAILLGFSVLVAALFVARRRELGRLVDELTVDRAEVAIEILSARRDRIKADARDRDQRIADLDKDIAFNKRELIEAHEFGKGRSDEEIDFEYARLGY